MAKSAWMGLAAIVSLLLLWAALQFYVWTPVGVKRDSLVFTWKIPDRAKHVPLWNPHDEPTYDLGAASGIAPDNTTVRYQSKSPLRALEQRARAENYGCQRLGELVLTCDRTREGALESQVTARYEPRTGLSEITVYVPK